MNIELDTSKEREKFTDHDGVVRFFEIFQLNQSEK